ncbi:hypothetical protein ACRAWC_20640 [Leifsonia sp. L25]|uniref:hypothetical protein n=1 Tax=Leifsonia sp. L25 TaxID=3423957 RepID=UPI003D69157E
MRSVVGDRVYAYATNTPAVNVQLATSTDMKTWKLSDQMLCRSCPRGRCPARPGRAGPTRLADDRFAPLLGTGVGCGQQVPVACGVAFADKP